ncbi:hypothetical protein [Halodesulfovibrio spirochaetisodalis]|uniref:hypothetical protein n=1 Tax=Halodesulfovibrio spirochaetisodalis TaxID=1560234 RepID=UPI000A9E8476|nr:hypothetical protein [Halodesulfovibrio spirochaetisodalis]
MNRYGYDEGTSYPPAINDYPQGFHPVAGFHNNSGSSSPSGPIILVGLTAICRAVGAGPGTIKKWMKEENFPVRKCSDGIYRASPESVRDWFAAPRTDSK